MGAIVANLLSGGLLNGVSNLISVIKGKNPGDAEKLAELASKYQSEILAADTAALQAQADINKAEAYSGNLFVAGWRPWIGWVCGAAFAYSFVIQPFLQFGFAAAHSPVDPAAFPKLDLNTMMPVLLGMLGLGGMRTYEKVNGIKTGH